MFGMEPRVFKTQLSKDEVKAVLDNEYHGKPLSEVLRDKANALMLECGCECHTTDEPIRHITACCALSCSKFKV